MERDEILKRVKMEESGGSDEMELQVTQKGSGIAMFCVFVFALILMIVKMVVDQPWYDVYSLLFAGTAGAHLYKGIRLHQRHEIVLGVFAAAAAALALAGAIWEYLG
ncbi:MAG: DUF6442 family protein [Oscillibacter sp.]|jgi:uncharacterized membrane protein YjjP (DUF1212 family)|nr:DUF6442 family protein [Oscillibacter sp.]